MWSATSAWPAPTRTARVARLLPTPFAIEPAPGARRARGAGRSRLLPPGGDRDRRRCQRHLLPQPPGHAPRGAAGQLRGAHGAERRVAHPHDAQDDAEAQARVAPRRERASRRRAGRAGLRATRPTGRRDRAGRDAPHRAARRVRLPGPAAADQGAGVRGGRARDRLPAVRLRLGQPARARRALRRGPPSRARRARRPRARRDRGAAPALGARDGALPHRSDPAADARAAGTGSAPRSSRRRSASRRSPTPAPASRCSSSRS